MPEYDALQVWTSHLTTLQNRTRQLNNGTPNDLAAFAKAKPSSLLLSNLAQKNLQSDFQQNTNITIDLNDIANKATFRDLLDQYTTQLQNSVEIRMRSVAAGIDAADGSMKLSEFEKLKTAAVFPTSVIVVLCQALGDGTGNLLKVDGAFKTLLAAPATTVLDAAKSILP